MVEVQDAAVEGDGEGEEADDEELLQADAGHVDVLA